MCSDIFIIDVRVVEYFFIEPIFLLIFKSKDTCIQLDWRVTLQSVEATDINNKAGQQKEK